MDPNTRRGNHVSAKAVTGPGYQEMFDNAGVGLAPIDRGQDTLVKAE